MDDNALSTSAHNVKIVISVHTEDSKERARAELLETLGATDVSYSGEASVPKDRAQSERVVTKEFSGEVTRGAGEMRDPGIAADESRTLRPSELERPTAPASSGGRLQRDE